MTRRTPPSDIGHDQLLINFLPGFCATATPCRVTWCTSHHLRGM